MPSVNLQPIAKSDESMLSYLDINFRRISDTLGMLTDLEQGIISVNGSVEIDTGIAEVYNCYATLNGPPASTACFVRCYPKGPTAPRNIVIEVYNNSFGSATTAVNIAWQALGK